MTIPNVQSSSVPCFVEVVGLMGMEFIIGYLVALKMSLTFYVPGNCSGVV